MSRNRAGDDGSGYPLFSEGSWRELAGLLDLSPREVEIACGIVCDEKEAAIARRLGVSRSVVDDGLQNMYRRLEVHSRVQLVVRLASEYLSCRSQTQPRRVSGSRVNGEDWPLFGVDAWRNLASDLGLSPRQFEIARGIVRDELECRMARRLGVTVHTVHRQTQRLYKKAEASGRVRLVARLITEHVSGNGL